MPRRVLYIAVFLAYFSLIAWFAVMYPDPGSSLPAAPVAETAAVDKNPLAPVYAPLADWIVERFDFSRPDGVGIDLGGGRGHLIVELCKRTEWHWINADVDTGVFFHLFQSLHAAGLDGRAGALYADVHRLPFRDNYADFLVSRGSFHFWDDLELGLSEALRVLKPGASALIGRGFSPNLPVETAREVRRGQRDRGIRMTYSVDEAAERFEAVMKNLGVAEYRVHLPKPPGSKGIKYGLWLEFRKAG